MIRFDSIEDLRRMDQRRKTLGWLEPSFENVFCRRFRRGLGSSQDGLVDMCLHINGCVRTKLESWLEPRWRSSAIVDSGGRVASGAETNWHIASFSCLKSVLARANTGEEIRPLDQQRAAWLEARSSGKVKVCERRELTVCSPIRRGLAKAKRTVTSIENSTPAFILGVRGSATAHLYFAGWNRALSPPHLSNLAHEFLALRAQIDRRRGQRAVPHGTHQRLDLDAVLDRIVRKEVAQPVRRGAPKRLGVDLGADLV